MRIRYVFLSVYAWGCIVWDDGFGCGVWILLLELMCAIFCRIDLLKRQVVWLDQNKV